MFQFKKLLCFFMVVGFVVFGSSTAFAEKYVIIDPGHGGKFSGTTGYSGSSSGFYEKDGTLAIGKNLRNYLNDTDIKVYMTRDVDKEFASNKQDDLKNRMSIANQFAKGNNKNAIFISVHHNAAWNNPYVNGIETYYYDKSAAYDPEYPPDPMQVSFEEDSRRLAHLMQPNIVKQTGFKDNFISNTNSFYVTRNAQMPSVLVELGYMSNPDEEARIKTSTFQWNAARGLKDAILKYFNVYEVYNHKDERLKVSESKEEAISFAKNSDDVYVFDKDAQEVIFSNISEDYIVLHETKGQIGAYMKEENAIEHASNQSNTRVVHTDSNHIVWSNYLEKTYEVYSESDALFNKFYEFEQAISYANWKKEPLKIKRSKREEILWTNIEGMEADRVLRENILAGTDRIETAIKISDQLYPEGFGNKPNRTIVLTTAYNFADALSVGPLAAQEGNAPILLTDSTELDDRVKTEINRLGADKVIIVGGEKAINNKVEDELKGMKSLTKVERIAESNRYATNRAIINRLDNVNGVFVASGDKFPDALGAAPIAAANDWAIVLTKKDKIAPEMVDYMNDKNVKIVGGTSVINTDVEAKLKANNGQNNVERLAGAGRYQTLAALLNEFEGQLNSDAISVSTGSNFPDALAASSLSVKTKAPLILVDGEMHPIIDSFIIDYGYANKVTEVNTVGGLVGRKTVSIISNKLY